VTEDEAEALFGRAVAAMDRQRAFAVPPHEASPDDVSAALVRLRAQLDTAEVVLVHVYQLRADARARFRRADAAAGDAYDEALAKLAKTAVRREYEGVQDRLVSARVAALPLRQEARSAERVRDMAEVAAERVRASYFAMRDIREELLSRLRHAQWESHLER
jgi:hypothetical protein